MKSRKMHGLISIKLFIYLFFLRRQQSFILYALLLVFKIKKSCVHRQCNTAVAILF